MGSSDIDISARLANENNPHHRCDVLVIGGGPAGLMAAEAALAEGASVILADAMPSLGRKFLMAGKSGLNLTKDEPLEKVLSAYGPAQSWLAPIITELGPQEIKHWAEGLGQNLFTGSSGRVFPNAMKASPLLRAWLQHLQNAGLVTHTKWQWEGWAGEDVLFSTPDGNAKVTAHSLVLALGGASWPRLGSTGSWTKVLAQRGVTIAPFKAANMGFHMQWTPYMRSYFGAPIKNLALSAGTMRVRGEIVITQYGIEGGGLYAVAGALRDGARLTLDLTPELSTTQITARLDKAGRKRSLPGRLKRGLRWDDAKLALFFECAPKAPFDLPDLIKALPMMLGPPMPMETAISTAGGISASELTPELMLVQCPNVYACGEMLDWEAPTGGYLLTACLATGRHAGKHAARTAMQNRACRV